MLIHEFKSANEQDWVFFASSLFQMMMQKEKNFCDYFLILFSTICMNKMKKWDEILEFSSAKTDDFDECRRSFTEVKCRILNLLFSRNFPIKIPYFSTIFFSNFHSITQNFSFKNIFIFPKKKNSMPPKKKTTKIVQTVQLLNATKRRMCNYQIRKTLGSSPTRVSNIIKHDKSTGEILPESTNGNLSRECSRHSSWWISFQTAEASASHEGLSHWTTIDILSWTKEEDQEMGRTNNCIRWINNLIDSIPAWFGLCVKEKGGPIGHLSDFKEFRKSETNEMFLFLFFWLFFNSFYFFLWFFIVE